MENIEPPTEEFNCELREYTTGSKSIFGKIAAGVPRPISPFSIVDTVRDEMRRKLAEKLKAQIEKHFPGVPYSELECVALSGGSIKGIQFVVNGKLIMDAEPIEPQNKWHEFRIGAKQDYKLY